MMHTFNEQLHRHPQSRPTVPTKKGLPPVHRSGTRVHDHVLFPAHTLDSDRKIEQDSQNQAYAKYLARAFEFNIFPVRQRRFPRNFLPRLVVLTSAPPPASALVTQPEILHVTFTLGRLQQPAISCSSCNSEPTHHPSTTYGQCWTDQNLSPSSRLSQYFRPPRADEQFFNVGLPFLLG